MAPSKKKTPPKVKKPRGRPTKYNEEFVTKFCEKIATSEKGLHAICKQMKVSPSQVFKWLSDEDKKNFADKYAHAKELQAELIAEKIINISDDNKKDETAFVGINHIHRAKLKVDSRKWLLSKLLPKKYGDRLDLDHTTGGEKLNQVSEETLLKIAEKINSNAAS